MGYETIEITPMTPRIGAEVSGIDLTKSLGNQQFQELHDALMEHSVLFSVIRTSMLNSIKILDAFLEIYIFTRDHLLPGPPRDINRSCRQGFETYSRRKLAF